MKKVGDLFAMLIGGALSLAIFGGWIFGTYHAFERHGAGMGVLSLFAFVPGHYFAIESFWHEEEWEENFDQNSEILTTLLLTEYHQDLNPVQKMDVVRIKEEIKKWIHSMPEEEKLILQNSCNAFVSFFASRELASFDLLTDQSVTVESLINEQARLVENTNVGIDNDKMREFFALALLNSNEMYKILQTSINSLESKLNGMSIDEKNEFKNSMEQVTQAKEEFTKNFIDRLFHEN